MKVILFISLFLFQLTIFCQSGIQFLLPENASKQLDTFSLQNHSSIKPQLETIEQIRRIFPKKDPDGKIISLYRNFKITPKIWFEQMNYLTEKHHSLEATPGIWIETKFKTKLSASFGVRYIYQTLLQKADSSNTILNSNELIPTRFLQNNIDIRGKIRYSPNKHFDFLAGRDQFFIGEGSRSLLLSDYGSPFQFIQGKMKFWRINYVYMMQFLKEENQFGQKSNKYATTHFLDYNIGKGFNIGVFESVMFRPKDSLLNRGFDPEYLNPFVFFRPQEFQIGSADNVLIGLNAHYSFKKHRIYSQLLIDEFLLAELKNNKGWWGNKYAIQFGLKGSFRKNKFNYFYRGEFNHVQKFTYSHISNFQNYGNANKVLAHPFQSGFQEILGEFSVLFETKLRIRLDLFGAFVTGFSKSTENTGQNIYEPYSTRLTDYGFKTPNLLKNDSRFFGNIRLSISTKHYPAEFFMQSGIRATGSNFFSLGIRSTFHARYFN